MEEKNIHEDRRNTVSHGNVTDKYTSNVKMKILSSERHQPRLTTSQSSIIRPLYGRRSDVEDQGQGEYLWYKLYANDLVDHSQDRRP